MTRGGSPSTAAGTRDGVAVGLLVPVIDGRSVSTLGAGRGRWRQPKVDLGVESAATA